MHPFTGEIKQHPANCADFLRNFSNPIVYGIFLFFLLLWLLTEIARRFFARSTSRATSLDLEKPGTEAADKTKVFEKQPGIWIPVDFKRPAAEPYPDWDVHKTRPLPYRPFKYGKYNITMGLRSMKWDDWIELDNHYLKYHADKARRIKERGERCNRTAPEAFDGAVELLEEL